MTVYRWNVSDVAADYDRIAPTIHPYYAEIQQELLDRLPHTPEEEFFLVDAGGGSGRLVQRLLGRFPLARAMIIDQSEAFLALAQRRLEPFGDRVSLLPCRLQDDWPAELPQAPSAIVSMSAIHHLDPGEKQRFYGRCHDALSPRGVLMNADEVRHEDDCTYLAQMTSWAARMREICESGELSAQMRRTLGDWKRRNVDNFGEEKLSGDDCHETIEAQLGYLRDSGFVEVSLPWQQEMWAILRAEKSST